MDLMCDMQETYTANRDLLYDQWELFRGLASALREDLFGANMDGDDASELDNQKENQTHTEEPEPANKKSKKGGKAKKDKQEVQVDKNAKKSRKVMESEQTERTAKRQKKNAKKPAKDAQDLETAESAPVLRRSSRRRKAVNKSQN